MKTAFVLAASAAVSAVSASTLANLVIDLNGLNNNATSLLSQLQATDGSDLFTDLSIDSAAQTLNKAIQGATKDVKALNAGVTDIDTEGAIYLLQKTEVTTKAICNRLVTMKKAFTKAGAASIVAADVGNISASINKFGPALVALAPAASQANATALYKQFQADLKICTKAYPQSS